MPAVKKAMAQAMTVIKVTLYKSLGLSQSDKPKRMATWPLAAGQKIARCIEMSKSVISVHGSNPSGAKAAATIFIKRKPIMVLLKKLVKIKSAPQR